MKIETQKINAVFDGDLEKILKELGIYQDTIEGNIGCFFCKDIITLDNLEYIFSNDRKIVISCNKLECKKQLTTEKNHAN